MSKPAWANEEEQRVNKLLEQGGTANNDAPQLKRIEREPSRMQKAFYIQPKYAEAFDLFALKQKRKKGKKSTELAEEAIKMILEYYGEDISNLV
jgi:hypothetical protein